MPMEIQSDSPLTGETAPLRRPGWSVPARGQLPISGARQEPIWCRVMATDSEGDSSVWSDNLEVTIAAANQPPRPPTAPLGPVSGNIERSYSYSASANDPDGDDVQLTFDWGDASQSVTEFVRSSEVISASHTWQRSGTYYVRAKSTDSKGGQSSWSSYCRVRISDTSNSPPRKPSTPAGVGTGFVGRSYSFMGYASDPNQDQIFYTFDWGDGSTTQTELVKSGISARVLSCLEPGGNLSGPGHGHRQQWSRISLVFLQEGDN